MKKHLRILFGASFFFSAQLALLAYINSSSLARFLSDRTAGIAYAASAILSMALLAYAPRFLRKHGVWKTALLTLCTAIALLLLIAVFSGSGISVLLFVLYFSLNTIIIYLFDIFIEHYSSDGITGKIRGFYLTLGNMAWIGAPFVAGQLIERFGFGIVYFIGALLLLPAVFLLLAGERGFIDRPYRIVSFKAGLHALKDNKAVRAITFLDFLLQFFYVWMVIYTPLYLIHMRGFSWGTVGVAFSIMLVPFVIFEYPAGRIADTLLGEKELLIGGFLIMSLATLGLALTTETSILTITALLVTSRIGASLTESMCETYFFKHVSEKETVFISFFRDMVPFAYIIGSVFGTLLLLGTSYEILFLILAALMLIGAGVGFTLKDTK